MLCDGMSMVLLVAAQEKYARMTSAEGTGRATKSKKRGKRGKKKKEL